jgi:hypothetical protein
VSSTPEQIIRSRLDPLECPVDRVARDIMDTLRHAGYVVVPAEVLRDWRESWGRHHFVYAERIPAEYEDPLGGTS